MKKVVCYGIGFNFNTFMRYGDLNDFEIVALADSYKHGKKYNKWLIKHPDEIKDIIYDEIYLFVIGNAKEEIINYLTDELQIERLKIRCTYELNQHYLIGSCNFTKYRYVMFTDAQEFLNYPYDDLCARDDFLMTGIMDQEEQWVYDGKSFDKEIIFIFRDHCYKNFNTSNFIIYVKQKYPYSKMVLVISDSIDGQYGRLEEYGSDYVNKIKNTFDLVMTYHSKEAHKYGLTYYQQTYPLGGADGFLERSRCQSKTPSYDVLFLGRAKDRLELIHRTFIHLKENGVTCRFWIADVNEEDQLQDEDITYNTRLPYKDYLNEIPHCRCILEICKHGNETSYRYAEAIVNNKKLIVNDAACKNKKYYCEDFMQYISKPEDIDCQWIKNECIVDYQYKNDFSPENFLLFLEHELSHT